MNDILKQTCMVVLGGFLASVGGIVVAFWSDRLTKKREQIAGVQSRKREFVAFIESWKYEIGRLTLVPGGFERNDGAFTNIISVFIERAAVVWADLPAIHRAEFSRLCSDITRPKHPTIYNKEDHDKAIEALNRISEFIESH